MSVHQAFRRQPVPQQYAQALKTVNIPAPTRGIVQDENEAYMQPGGCIVLDNWKPTLRGIALRGGCERWCELPETTPIVSAFEYITGTTISKMFVANETKVYDVTTNTPVLVKSGQASGNYVAAQMVNAAGDDHLLACNDAGDYVLRFDGTTWTTLDAGQITAAGPGSAAVAAGQGLVYVWKHRSRLYFIEVGSMNAWYLGVDAIGGALTKLPLSGAATKGGRLLFGASWSLDAGDGIDQKCVFVTNLGEVLIFAGTNPGDAATWRQEGRYDISPPMGMNAHTQIGGDLIIMTVDGMVPLSLAIQKSAGQLELAMLSRHIKPMWREMVNEKREHPWTIKHWDEYGGIFLAIPGGSLGQEFCLGINNATGAFCRFTGWDVTCWVQMRADMFFGTQTGIVMQADRTGYDDGHPYTATLVGGWEMFQSPPHQVIWHQARAVFTARWAEPFQPQISACTDFVVTIPPPPPIGPDPGVLDLWDEGVWDEALWDAAGPGTAPHRNTMWVSIGLMGFSHAPIVQVQVGQQAKPDVELIAISATFERAGVTV